MMKDNQIDDNSGTGSSPIILCNLDQFFLNLKTIASLTGGNPIYMDIYIYILNLLILDAQFY